MFDTWRDVFRPTPEECAKLGNGYALYPAFGRLDVEEEFRSGSGSVRSSPSSGSRLSAKAEIFVPGAGAGAEAKHPTLDESWLSSSTDTTHFSFVGIQDPVEPSPQAQFAGLSPDDPFASPRAPVTNRWTPIYIDPLYPRMGGGLLCTLPAITAHANADSDSTSEAILAQHAPILLALVKDILRNHNPRSRAMIRICTRQSYHLGEACAVPTVLMTLNFEEDRFKAEAALPEILHLLRGKLGLIDVAVDIMDRGFAEWADGHLERAMDLEGFVRALQGTRSSLGSLVDQDQLMETLMQDDEDKRRRTVMSSSSQGVTNPPENDETVTPDVNSNKLGIAEKLWNDAYDSLKAHDTELVTAYERVLSRELYATSSADARDNAIESTDTWKRQIQMEKLVQIGMQRTGGGNARVEKTMQSVLGLGNVIGTALQPVPQAALAWVGVSLILQMLVNPATETRANREGVSYIAARMDWYGELSQLLLKENTVDGGMSANLCSRLEGRIVELYTLLLSYLMKSVCSCYQNRALKYFQNAIKHNDWEGSLKEIHHAEKLVAQDATQYNTQQIRSDLEELVSVAHDRQTKLLSNIQEAVRNQAAQQVETKREEEDNKLLKHLCLTDPRDDMDRIEQTKDKLLEGSCDWIFDREDFNNWIYGNETTLYWIRGEPGKGKTMLLIGIIKQMLQSTSDIGFVSFFFCQNTDPNLNNATAVLRGLIYQLAVQDRSLLSYIRDAYDSRGQSLFDDRNAFFALSKILSKMLDDPNIPQVYLIIDALDECQTDLDQLLELLMQHVSSSRLRCLVSSRPRPEIRNSLTNSNGYTELDLGRNALQEVTEVVEEYIDREIADLAKQKKYSNRLQREVKDYLQRHADGTFLWVSLVCKQLRKTLLWKTPTVLKTFPSGLQALYGRMMEEVCQGDKESSETIDYCRDILAAVTVAHRPLGLDDLGLVANLPPELTADAAALEEVVDLCGDFLIVREGIIYFVHHSAKEYLFAHIDKDLFREGHIAIHSGIVSRALESMSATLCRDIWDLRDPGCHLDEIDPPDPNPLRHIGYACCYWVEHICELDAHSQLRLGLRDKGSVDQFFRQHFLHWLEALSLLQSMHIADQMLQKLEHNIGKSMDYAIELLSTVQDMKHFVEYHQHIMKDTPLQVYLSPLMFSPASSRVRSLFDDQVPSWITRRPLMEANWSLHLHPVYGDTGWRTSIAFFAEQQTLVAGSIDGTIEIWHTKTRVVERVFSSDESPVWSVAISPNGAKIASGSGGGTVRIWEVSTGSVIKTLEGHEDIVRSVTFSSDGKMVISGSYDRTIRIWDVQTGFLRHILRGHTDAIKCVVFLGSAQLASCGWDETVRVWDANTGDSHHVLEPDMGPIFALSSLANGEKLAIGAVRGVQIWHSEHAELLGTLVQCTESIHVSSLATSSNGRHLVAGFRDGAVRIWNAETGIVQQILQTAAPVECIAITPDGQKVALASVVTIYLWDTDIQTHQSPLTAHTSLISTIEVSPCQKWIATGAKNGTIGLWDRTTGLMVRMLHGHGSGIWTLSFSRDGRWIASASDDSTIRIWDFDTGETMHVLFGHTDRLTSVMFSADGKKIVSGARDKTIRIWNTDTGKLVLTICTQCSFTAAYSPDGLLIASGSINGLLEMRDAQTGNLIRNFVGMGEPVWSIKFTPDGTYLASAGDNIVQIYSVETGTLQQTLEAGTVGNLRFSEDSSTLITSRGQIALDWSLPQGSSTNASWIGYSLHPSDTWVTWNRKRLLRLPVECGSVRRIVTEQMIVLGYPAGRIVILEFDDDISPFDQQ
ncbi:WD40-repeat-containing domain protein [Aspergillus recurvatus]